MRRPSMRFLPREWAAAARAIAERLAGGGRRAWVVGGAVRDLALGLVPEDVDMASAAPPEEVERLFQRTHAVGRAFGTVVVRSAGLDVQLTTFRSESGYSDQRRPDQVRWGADLEEDAARRDFTCNALYLDPLTDELADPARGLADLERGVLRAVGDPSQRFREDGLRLVRLARFAGAYSLAVDPAATDSARSERAALAGVSPERVAEELRRIFVRRGSERALRLLDELTLLDELFPGLPPHAEPRARSWRALAALAPAPGFEEGLSVLLDPKPGGHALEGISQPLSEALLDSLRPSRDVRRTVLELWRQQSDARNVLALDQPARAARIRLARDPLWPRVERLLRAWLTADGEPATALDELQGFAAHLTPTQLHPMPFIRSQDLAEAGIARGPRWSKLLALAEELQLDGELATREEALAWLARQAAQ
jgi:tRNA nucleotidyltransferase/poly(A) polymerase